MSFSCSRSLDGSCPPSPVEDRGPQRLSWASLLQRLSELKGASPGATGDRDCRSEAGSVADLSLSGLDSSFFFPLEESLATQVGSTIAQSLGDASQLLGCSRLLLPDCLLHSISQELLHLAISEPCGLRGALIDLYVDKGDQGSLCMVDEIAVDPSLVPTFHMSLVLRLEPSGLWPKVQKLFKTSKPRHTSGPSLRLSPGFRAIKRKLYSSGGLLVEDCC